MQRRLAVGPKSDVPEEGDAAMPEGYRFPNARATASIIPSLFDQATHRFEDLAAGGASAASPSPASARSICV